MSFNYLYFRISGLAYQKGIENFDEIMPKERMASLLRAYSEVKRNLLSKGFEEKFINFIINICGREDRFFPQIPTCQKGCSYRMKYNGNYELQRNALRVEIFEGSDRCGYNLKDGRMGGHPDDYHICAFSSK